ncbi:MAG: family 10 glycosylhydrolase, partial [Victivallales bacterium]|nr:family 10 glycosylhydrolase [Victivallales bacterium]
MTSAENNSPDGQEGQKKAAKAQAWLATRPSRASELRGAWIHRPFGLPGKNWDETIKVLADTGFNAIFVNMAWGYCADYESQVLPVHPDVAKRGDQLALCLAACRKYGVELHVWKVCWNMGHRTPKALIEQMQKAGRTQRTAAGKDTLYLAPHRQDNFELERDALLEIVRKYPVDGIHLDYIRYPDAGCDFSEGAKEAFAAWLKQRDGQMSIAHWPEDCQEDGPLWRYFLDWRRRNINRLVQAVHEGVKRTRPEVAVSAAVYGSWDGAPLWIGQDAETWMRNHWIDFVCPMDYTANDREFTGWLKRQLPLVDETGIPLYVGIGAWKLKTPEAVARQMLLARQLGADGLICFSLNPAFAQDVLPGLKAGVTSMETGALLPHHSRSLRWEMPAGQPGLFGHLRQGDSFTASVLFDTAEEAARVSVTVEKDGVPQGTFGLLPTVMRAKEGALLACTMKRARPGRYRILLKDEKARLLHRSPVVSVLSPAEAKEVRLREGTPQFARRKGLRVGVWVDNTYGGEPILQALQSVGELNAAPLYNLKPESLDACQVVVLTPPRVLFIPLQSHALR